MKRKPYNRWRYVGKRVDPFYRSRAWQMVRKHILYRDQGLCQICGKRFANTVHHIIPRNERPDLALAPENLEASCAVCHNQAHPEKGRREEAGEEKPRIEGIRVVKL